MSDKSCENCASYEDNCYCSKHDGIVCCRGESWRSWEPKDCYSCEYSCSTCYKFVGLCADQDQWKQKVEESELEEPQVEVPGDDGNPFNTQIGGTHYKKADGCPDVAEWCGMQSVEFLEGNVIKYVFRHERKNGLEDIEKAMQYLRFIAWVKYGKTL